jgi:molybdopterin-synthase adenylyltransferase
MDSPFFALAFYTNFGVQTVQYIIGTKGNVSTGNLRQLRKYIRKFKREEVLIFRLPRTKEGEVLFGVRCGGVAGCHPLVPGGSVRELTPIQLMRMDKEYLLPRSGANPGLSGKKVALIGCGAVGGFVALELVRMGILNLTLIDPDDLSGDNTFRHVLGQQGSGRNKAVALKEEIERKFPYVSIQAISLAAEQALVAGCFHPRAFDLIVVAIGAPMTSLHLNKLFHDRSGTPPTLFTWLEAYGIGGHALLTLNGCRQGCLACLFTPLTEEDEGTGDRSSFAAKGQVFAKDLRGCGMSFTPFGSLAAVRTAALAVELAGQALSGAITGNPLRSWKGDAQEFLHTGYCVSDRYRLSAEELFKQRFLYMNPRCPVCGQGKWYG